MRQISFLDLKWQHETISEELSKSFNDVLCHGNFILGEQCSAFEREFSKYLGSEFCYGVGNGLDAIRIALQAIGIKPGDEVIVPANTFIATWFAVSQLGAIPIPVDSSPTTFNIDTAKIEEKISPRTKAIIPVHLYGHPVEMSSILALAQKYNIKIIEDAAQAHGAKYDGKNCGTIGDLGCFSFYPGKNLGALGDGGAITIKADSLLGGKVAKLRNYGSLIKYHHDEIGANSRLDEMQASFLRVKLTKLNSWNNIRRQIADVYFNEVASPNFQFPIVPDKCQSSWHLFPLLHQDRDQLKEFLARKGIPTLIHYPIPPHQSGAYSKEYQNTVIPIAENISKHTLSLPIGPHLSKEDASYVSSVLRSY